VPVPQPVAPPAPQVAPVAPPAEPTAPPKVEREIAPAIEPPREKAVPPAVMPPVERAAPPVERAAPPKIEREIAPAIEAPREKPTPVPQPVESVAPQKVEPQIAAPIETPAPRRAPADTGVPSERPASSIERTAPSIERTAPPAAVPGKSAAPPAPAHTDVPGEQAPRLRFGAPDAGDEIFKPRGDVAAPAAETGDGPRVDIDATRQRAREIATGYRGVAPVIPAPPPIERKSKLANAIEKAVKPDCRDAYAGLGLLAVVPLTVATIGDGGCRW
jgi:hypothetical protein